MSPLERRCRRLLLAYPAAYRAERGDEILDTVIESSPSGRLPAREAFGLIAGGLRVRAAQHRRLPTAVNVRLATLFGVTLWLAVVAVHQLVDQAQFQAIPIGVIDSGAPASAFTIWYSPSGGSWYHPPLAALIFNFVSLGALVALMVAAWFPRPRVLVPLAVVAAAGAIGWHWPDSALRLLVVALILLLTRGAERMPRAWLVPLALIAVSRAMGTLWILPHHTPWSVSTWATITAVPMWIAQAALVLWTFLDGRPLLGVAVTLALLTATYQLSGPWAADSLILPVLTAALLIPALLRVHRQARV